MDGRAAMHRLDLLAGHPCYPHEHLGRRAIRAPIEEASVRGNVAVVTPCRESEVMCGGEAAVCGIQAHPPAVGAADLGPRVRLTLHERLITGRAEIAADVARRPARATDHGEEQMGEVLAD